MGRFTRLLGQSAIGLWILFATDLCAAQGPIPATVPSRPSLHIRRSEIPPVIDGKIDDSAWEKAASIRDFTQVEPIEGAAPTEATELLILYDSDNLYIAIRCLDSEPDRIIGKQMQKDGDLDSDDAIEIAIDTFRDRRNGYFFQTGPAGARGDGLIEQGGDVRDDWDGIWEVATTRDEKGWYVEVRIPFKTVSFDARIDTWGFNVQRTIRRKQEVVRWAWPRNNTSVSDMGEAGDLIGLAGMRQGHGLTLKPFVATKIDLENGGDSTKPGFDLFYQITPSITAALTVNTDFAETEVDERQVNLTRFPLFFPEKRDFFLQDAGIFAFGGIAQSPLPFHSRRIGLAGGEEKDILAGLKVTGRQDRLSFGLLDVQMKDDDELGNKNLSVARATLNVLEESTVGVIATHGDPSTTGDNTLGGLDFNFRSSRIFGSEVVQGSLWMMGTNSSDGQEDDGAFGGRIDYPNDVWGWELAASQVGEDFNPALGFVRRRGVREYFAFGRYRHRWDAYIRRMDIEAETSLFTDLDNRLETLEGVWPQIEFENRYGDEIGFGIEHEIDNPTEEFDIADDILIPAGDYAWTSGFVFFETSESRPISLELRYSNGAFYDGDRQDYEIGMTWRPSEHFVGGFSFELNDIHLPQGDFIVRVIEGRADVMFSPNLAWSNIIQYDNESALLGLNSRVRWEIEPGQEIFVVLNHGFENDDGRFSTVSSEMTFKVGLTFRY